MDQQKLVSVVLTFYEEKHWLKEALTSVLEQTYKNIEIILVDDCSNEDINDVIEKFKIDNYIRHNKNGGCAAARNTGIQYSKGEYIAFMDSDDIWMPTKISKQVEYMERTESVWSHTGFSYWEYKTNKIKKINISHNYGWVYPEIMIAFKISHPSVMISRKWFKLESNPYYYEYARNGQDTILFSRIACRYPLLLLNESLMLIRLKGNNTNINSFKRIKVKSEFYKIVKNKIYPELLSIPLLFKVILFYYYICFEYFLKYFNGNKHFTLLYKMFWILPFIFERMLSKYYIFFKLKDKKYLINEITNHRRHWLFRQRSSK